MTTTEALLEANALASSPATPASSLARELATYSALGTLLGAILVKAEVISWYRIQEMFRFQGIHMYGILGSAMVTALLSYRLLLRIGARSLTREPIGIPDKELGRRGRRYWIGGSLFGIGWALTGACPGSLFALVGSGTTVFIIVMLAALAGTWTYGYLRPRLPH